MCLDPHIVSGRGGCHHCGLDLDLLLHFPLPQEEAKVMQKEQEAQEMAEKTREEIDNVMDGIQQGLRAAQDKLKRDIAESEKLPVEERARHQASLIRAFKDQLHDIMSLDSAGECGT